MNASEFATQGAQREWEHLQQVKGQYGPHFDLVLAVLTEYDPIGIGRAIGNPFEAETISPRLAEARSREDVERIVHEEMTRWFSLDLASPHEQFADIAEAIWDTMAQG